MKSYKKLFVVMVVAAMVFGMVSGAFAFSDISGNDAEDAVNRLAGLDLLRGYEDGTFRPDATITRAEFAAVGVRALGLENAASAAAGATKFSDVPASHWASGYINVATDQGLINGYPDGTFKPSNLVTHAEALTILVRVLGYDPVVKGTWPTNYIIKAAELGLDDGVTVFANLPATRGEVATFTDNSLTVEVLQQTGFGDSIKYETKDGETLLSERLKATSVSGWLTSSPAIFGAEDDEISIDGGAALTLANGANYAGLLGHKVKAWKNKDGKVFFIEDKSKASEVKSADRVNNTTVEINDKNVNLAGNIMFRNYADLAAVALQSGDEITVIYDGNDPKYVVALNYSTGVVDSTNSAYEKIYFESGSLTLKDKDVRWSGAASKLGDLEEDDVVQYISGADDAVLIVTRNAQSGKFTKLSSTKATVGGVEYKYVLNAGVDAALLSKTVDILLNKGGKIVKMSEASGEDTEVIAVATTKALTGYNDGEQQEYVKVLKADGTRARLWIEADYDASALDEIGDVFEYTLNSKGEIDSIDVLIDYDSGNGVDTITVDDDTHRVKSGGNWYTVGASAAIFDFTNFDGSDGDDISVATRDNLETNSSIEGLIKDDKAKAKAIVMTTGGGSDTFYALVTGLYLNSDKKTVVTTAGKTVTDYVYGTGDTNYTVDSTVISFKVSGDAFAAKPTVLTAEDLDGAEVEIRAKKIDGNLITAQGYDGDGEEVNNSVGYYVVNDDTAYVDVSGDDPVVATFGDLGKNDEITIYADADNIVQLILIH